MARPMSDETARSKTRESLENALKNNKLSEKFYQDKVEEYMSFYDDLKYYNSVLKDLKSKGISGYKAHAEVTKEKRMVSRSMLEILKFFGLKPSDDMVMSGGDDDEEL